MSETVSKKEIDDAVASTIAAQEKQMVKIAVAGIELTQKTDSIDQYLEEIARCEYSDEEKGLKSAKGLWKSRVVRSGLQNMIDICIIIVDIFCFCDIDIFSGERIGATKTLQLLMSE